MGQAAEYDRYSLEVVGTTNFRYVNFYHPSERVRAPLKAYADIDGVRGDLALVSTRNMINRGIPVVAADGGSSPDFLEALDEFIGKGLTLIPSDRVLTVGRAPQRRAAFSQAATLYPDKKIVLYYQPEKDLSEFIPFIAREFLEQEADVALLARDLRLFEQYYPPYMRHSELRVNRTYNRLMKRLGLMESGEEFDWFFGAFLFRNDPKVAKFFTRQYGLTYDLASSGPAEWIRSRVGAVANPEIFSGSHYLSIIEALMNRLKVIGIQIPYIYPASQLENEMSAENLEFFEKKRKEIVSTYLLEALHLIALLTGKSGSKLHFINDS